MKNLIYVLMLVVIAFSNAQKERTLDFNEESNLIAVRYYHENGKISQTGFYTIEGKLHGEWFKYSDEGKKLVVANYDNGVKVGKWLYWTEDSVKEVDYPYAVADVSQ